MKIGAPFIPPSLAAAGGDSLVLRGDALLLDKLTLGQIIKGRVLRSYEGQRYMMSFDGQERIVDSAVPLRTGDIVHGRVIGLGERIELQRVLVQPGDTPLQDDTPQQQVQARANLADPSLRFVAELFERHHAQVPTEDVRALTRQVNRAAQPDLMALSGLVLSKLNLRLAPEFLKALYDALERGARGRMFAPSQTAAEIDIDAAGTSASREPFASLLARMLMDLPENRRSDHAAPDVQRDVDAPGKTHAGLQGTNAGLASDSSRTQSGNGFDLARWILNAQNGGTVAHRVGTLPLLIGGRLVELDVALFEEHQDNGAEPSQIRHRRLVVAMETETLGRIEASALFAADHIRVTFSTSSSESTGALARRMGPLTAELEQFGWHVDEMKYETRAPVPPGAVLASVVEHLVSPGSVSTLA